MNNAKPHIDTETFDVVPRGTRPDQVARELRSFEGKLAQVITEFSGSMYFVYFHFIWFAFWITANYGLLKPFILPFDPFPYGLLTMIVSHEAIFLSTFIMIAQNRQQLIDTYRDLEEEEEEEARDKELDRDVDELQHDMDEIQKDLDKIMKSLSVMQTKMTTAQKHNQRPTPATT